MAFHPAYGNFTSADPPIFLRDHVLAVMRDNMSFHNDEADVLSCEYFQAYTYIKRSIRYNPEDLLVTQGIAKRIQHALAKNEFAYRMEQDGSSPVGGASPYSAPEVGR
jgi:hypothetical protein